MTAETNCSVWNPSAGMTLSPSPTAIPGLPFVTLVDVTDLVSRNPTGAATGSLPPGDIRRRLYCLQAFLSKGL